MSANDAARRNAMTPRRAIALAAALAALLLVSVPYRIAAQSSRQPDLEAIDRAWSDPGLDVETPGAAMPFAPPPEADIPNDVFGETIRRGMAIFTDTGNEAKTYVGSGLNCSSCHLDRGRRAGSAPMWAAWVRYPRFRAKNGVVNTMTMRIQGCFRFSMNGTPPPDDSEIITALQTYFYWLARGAPTGGNLAGAGFPRLAEPAEAPSLTCGATVFSGKCAACHGSNGEGRRVTGGLGYQFPPLWGAASYNWGAGMTSVATAAAFVRANMPYGLRDALTVQEAWDVAMFVDSHERPQDPRFTGNLAETRARYHDNKWSLYGTEQGGIRLGDPSNYPLPDGR
jgi:thiosulfate dehydrogenase